MAVGKRRVLVVTTAAAVAAAAVTVAATGVLRPSHPGTAAAGEQSVTPSPSATPSSTPTPSAAASLDPVLAAVDSARATDAAELARRIAGAGKSGGKVSAAVLSGQTGKLLYGSGADSALIPASTNKLLTSATALQLLGPQHRFTTKVVATAPLPTPAADPASAGPTPTTGAKTTASKKKMTGSIVLIGGGDPYLAGDADRVTDPGQSSLESLSAATAKRLKKAGLTSVKLGYDASLFAGPAWNPHWPTGYADVVTPTSALWADEGRLYGAEGPRQSDPAKSAANLFAAQLTKRGIKVSTVTTTDVNAKVAGAADNQVAAVESLSLEKIVERLLMASDNDATEVLLRQASLAAGGDGSITSGVATVRKTLGKLGAWVGSTHTYDGSGLSRSNRVSADQLVRVIDLAVSGKQPRLSPLMTGLPVAGVEGSLHYRFSQSAAAGGRGLVRAKTGTLSQVHSLAGYSYTRDGELLVYAFVVNQPKNDWASVAWLDRVSAAVATCGCRS
ncbi:D-alanyl-D-alanine carboxypeptidase/D-alanyl-D-alanine endopeptidase [Microlunatus elymi]|uniref:D-alanyl-D-alanine carboxypeptidase/D-alanyl-D-alanine endopeptidase n=1 Tax=Microlunatus elymi TaxID=2596828 RepID=UPI00143DB3B7|nr:D-alanyl-D-alanine carboxypeptidase/D-alanyl-D-alanine-endopeptidase [Microlunatus elymi]